MTVQQLSLQEHLDHLGLTPRTFALQLPDVPQAAIERALSGQPIAHSVAVKICNKLTKLHNLDSKRPFWPSDLGITTVNYGYQEDSMQRNTAGAILRNMEATDQVRLAAAIIHNQNQQRAIRAAVEMALRTPEVQRLVVGMIERNQRRPVYAGAPAGMLTRNGRTVNLAQMEADQARDNRRLAELRRQVARERTGSR